jgi:hypothetical protein
MLQGNLGDDDFYASPADTLSDFNSPYFGADRLFRVSI